VRLAFTTLAILSAGLLIGCAAAPAIAGYATSGGVTLYKKATETGPKAEFVLVKFEIHHDTITTK
jgi:hypothetical protein